MCIQHEMDHLEGKLFVDYLSDLKRERIRKKLDKERKERASAPDARAGQRAPRVLVDGKKSPAALFRTVPPFAPAPGSPGNHAS